MAQRNRSSIVRKVTGTMKLYPGVSIHLGARLAKAGSGKDVVPHIYFKGRKITSDIVVFEERISAESACNRSAKHYYEMLSQKWCKKLAKEKFETLISRQIATATSISIDGDRKNGDEVQIILKLKLGRVHKVMLICVPLVEVQFFFR